MKVTTLKSCEGFMQSDREVRSRRNKLSNRDMPTLKLNPPWRIYPCIRDHTIPKNGWHARPYRLTYLHLGGRSNPHNPPFSPRCSPGTSEGIASVRQRFPVPGCKLLKCRKVPRVNMINVNWIECEPSILGRSFKEPCWSFTNTGLFQHVVRSPSKFWNFLSNHPMHESSKCFLERWNWFM